MVLEARRWFGISNLERMLDGVIAQDLKRRVGVHDVKMVYAAFCKGHALRGRVVKAVSDRWWAGDLVVEAKYLELRGELSEFGKDIDAAWEVKELALQEEGLLDRIARPVVMDVEALTEIVEEGNRRAVVCGREDVEGVVLVSFDLEDGSRSCRRLILL